MSQSIDKNPARVSPSSIWCLTLGAILGIAGLIAAAVGFGYYRGSQQRPIANLSEAVLHATATHGGTNVAIATGQVGEEAEGIYILDYLTGNLQCWVYYPRIQQFGAKFETNVTAQLPATKNAEYLLITGNTGFPASTSTNARPAACICYVVDPKSGMFAGYSLPWNRSAENSGQMQRGMMFCVGGDVFRSPSGGGTVKKPVPTKESEKGKAGATK